MTSNERTTMAASQQLVDAVQTAYLKKDFITLHELVPSVLRRIASLQRQIELMGRSFDYDGEAIEAKEEG